MIISLSGIEPQLFSLYDAEQNELGDATLFPAEEVSSEAFQTSLENGTPVGVRVKGDENPDLFDALLESIKLIEIAFPAFGDGRGFSLAAIFRRKGYKGELRATGPLIPDQAWHIARTGFDTVVLDKPEREEAFINCLKRYKLFYQTSPGNTDTAVPFKRHVGKEATKEGDRIAS
ncbi:DUF934 domain-containing protein [Temperatibacter marinus]|uniref:DUF934 domain-containing protein n=1 Tax=Temperatibacter marinus TaxID=1456591 RepID=A0AA52EEV1_9PROT|nr:DUF934 domain-containing protein [Temperatibacter marinus]WND01525.1 DUF934 domain-containing protein [Temperatibacter marinus]